MKSKYMIVLIIIIILCACFLIICTAIAYNIYSKTFRKTNGRGGDGFSSSITWKEIDKEKYSREEIHFFSQGNELQGFIYGEKK